MAKTKAIDQDPGQNIRIQKKDIRLCCICGEPVVIGNSNTACYGESRYYHLTHFYIGVK